MPYSIFAVQEDHWLNIKESEMIDKDLDLARQLRKPRDMSVMVTLIIIGALVTVAKRLEGGLEKLEINKNDSRPSRLQNI